MRRLPAAPGGQDPFGAQLGFERFLLDQVEAADVATDVVGTITSWNRFAEELLGYRAEEAIGRGFVELLIHPDERAAVVGILECLGTGDSWQGEIDVVSGDGRQVPTRMRASPAYDPSGVFVGMAGVLVDVTEQRRNERRRTAQYAVTRVLADAATLSEAAPQVLEALATSLDWETGSLWVLDRGEGRLRCVETW